MQVIPLFPYVANSSKDQFKSTTVVSTVRELGVNNAARYYAQMTIRSFKCADTEALFNRERVRRFSGVQSVARRKLEQLDWAVRLDDLRVPPGNRLEALKGDRTGQHSIRVNDQFRVCFKWTPEGPCDVEILDYH